MSYLGEAIWHRRSVSEIEQKLRSELLSATEKKMLIKELRWHEEEAAGNLASAIIDAKEEGSTANS